MYFCTILHPSPSESQRFATSLHVLFSSMADEDGLDTLKERLKGHSNCFNSLLGLIPPKYYFTNDDEKQGGKFYKNKKNKAPKQAVKEATKKSKLSRLDPSKHKSIIELQAECSSKEGKRTYDENHVSVEDVHCSNIGDLRTKLHERIQSLKRKRKTTSESKPEANRPTKKSKKKVKDEKNSKKSKVGLNLGDVNGKEALLNNKKAITNNDGKVVFSKFDFTTDPTKTQSAGKGKMKKKNYKKLLEKAESRKKKLQEMKATDTKEAKEIVESMSWKKALGKSEGLKPKDDPALLKKSLKRKEKQKGKHQKEWKVRVESQANDIKERQERRQKNIKERIENKKNNKRKKMKKGGRTPGF